MKLKILTICYDFDLGGTQRAAQNFSLGLIDAGHEVKALGLSRNGIRQKPMEERGVVFFTPYEIDPSVLTQIMAWKPDIIHLHQAGNYEERIQKILKQLKNAISTLRVLETNIFSLYNAKESCVDLHAHLSKTCLWKWQLQIPRGKTTPKAVILPYMVACESFFRIQDESVIREFKNKVGIPQGQFILGRIGQKSPAKWSKHLLQAFQKILLNDSKIHLVLVGAPESIVSQYQTMQESLSGRVTFLDYFKTDEELNLIYNCFDTFVLTANIGESFGMVLAESLLTETPVVALSTPDRDNSQIEVVPHMTAGLIAKDTFGLVMAIKQLQYDSALRLKLGKQGREHILQNFSSSVLTPKTEKIMHELKQDSLKKDKLASITKNEIIKMYRNALGNTPLKIKLFFLFPKFYIWARENYQKLKS